MKKVIVAGASGAAGSAALELFTRQPGWEVVGVSRRPPIVPLGPARHLSVDLLDRAACARIFGEMADATHVVFAALNEREDDVVAGWSDPVQIAKNQAMLANLFDPLIGAAERFEHISLVHGPKAYGIHIPGLELPLPLRETQPRFDGENFYFQQEDYLAEKRRATNASWNFTVLRPYTIVGPAIGGNLSPFLVLAVFAALRREAGLDLPMPAGRGDVVQFADAALVAQALLWAAETPAAGGEIFNVANGDVFSIHDAFPLTARAMGMTLGEPRHFDIADELHAVEHLWPGMVRKYGLAAPEDLHAVLGNSPQMARGWAEDVGPENVLRWNLCSTIKLRRAGFTPCMDTAEMLQAYIQRFQELKIIPPGGEKGRSGPHPS